MLTRDGPQLFEQLGLVLGDVRRHRHRKTPYSNRLGGVREQVVARIEDPATIPCGNLNELQQSRDVPLDRDVSVLTLELPREVAPIRRYLFRMPFDAITHRPGRTLREPINRPHHQLH